MDVMSIRRRLLMQSVQTGSVDLFNGSDKRNDSRIAAYSNIGSPVELLSTTYGDVYAFSCEVTLGEQYKISYIVTNPLSTNARQCCISNSSGILIYISNMTIPMDAGQNEVTITAQANGFLWMTMDKNASDIHIYKV